MNKALIRQTRKALDIDKETGLFGNLFTVEVQDDALVFSFEETPWDPKAPTPLGDLRSVIARMINLVEINPDRTYEEILKEGEPARLLHRHMDKEAECRLKDTSMEELVDLAYEIGPLFGVFDFDEGRVDGLTVCEPIEWWRAAAGTLACASRLRDAATDFCLWHAVDNEVNLCFAEIEGARYLKAIYVTDLGFPGAYGRMIVAGESEYHRAFPAIRVDNEGGEVFYRGGIESKGGITRRMAPYPALIRRSKYLRSKYDERENDRLRKESRGFVLSLEGCPRCICVRNDNTVDSLYVVRGEGHNDELGYPFGVDPYLGGPLPDEGRYAVLCSPIQYQDPIWSKMYQNLYDVMVRLHTRHNSLDYEYHQVASPFYECALERIWCAFAVQATEGRVVTCRNCNKAFVLEKGERSRFYCSDACRDAYNKTTKRIRRAVRIKEEIMRHDCRDPFTTSSICRDLNIVGKEKEVELVMEQMKKEGWRFKRKSGRYPSYTVDFVPGDN